MAHTTSTIPRRRTPLAHLWRTWDADYVYALFDNTCFRLARGIRSPVWSYWLRELPSSRTYIGMISAAAACPSGLCLRSRLRLGSAISRQIELVEPEQREKEQAASDAAFLRLLRARSARGLPLPQLNQEGWSPGCEGDRPS